MLSMPSLTSPVTTQTLVPQPGTVTPMTFSNSSKAAANTLFMIKGTSTTYPVAANSENVYEVFSSNIFTQMLVHPSGWAYLYSDSNITYSTASNYIFSYNLSTKVLSNLGFSTPIYHMALDPLGFIFISLSNQTTKYRVNISNSRLTELYTWTVPRGSKIHATLGYFYAYIPGTLSNIVGFTNMNGSSPTNYSSSIFLNDGTLSSFSTDPKNMFLYSTTSTGKLYSYSVAETTVRIIGSNLDTAMSSPFVDTYTNTLYISLTNDISIQRVPLDGSPTSNIISLNSTAEFSGSNRPALVYSIPIAGLVSPTCVLYNPVDFNIYVCTLNLIRKITLGGLVTVFAGKFPGNGDGIGIAASFNQPHAMTLDESGSNLFIADTGNNSIRMANLLTSNVTTVVTGFSGPQGIALDASNIYIADTGNHVIQKYTFATSNLSIIAGSNGVPGWIDASSVYSKLNSPRGLAFDSNSSKLIVADYSNYVIRKMNTSTYFLSTYMGTQGVSGNTLNSLGAPTGLLIQSNGLCHYHKLRGI
jgi:hypothetical protein